MPNPVSPTMPPDVFAVTTAFIEAMLPRNGDMNPVRTFLRKLNEQGWFVVDQKTVDEAAHYRDLCDEPVDMSDDDGPTDPAFLTIDGRAGWQS